MSCNVWVSPLCEIGGATSISNDPLGLASYINHLDSDFQVLSRSLVWSEKQAKKKEHLQKKAYRIIDEIMKRKLVKLNLKGGR